MRQVQRAGHWAAKEMWKMKLKKHHTAGLIMAAVKEDFDLYPQAGRGDRCAEHLFLL